jgi:hypothetical protein
MLRRVGSQASDGGERRQGPFCAILDRSVANPESFIGTHPTHRECPRCCTCRGTEIPCGGVRDGALINVKDRLWFKPGEDYSINIFEDFSAEPSPKIDGLVPVVRPGQSVAPSFNKLSIPSQSLHIKCQPLARCASDARSANWQLNRPPRLHRRPRT